MASVPGSADRFRSESECDAGDQSCGDGRNAGAWACHLFAGQRPMAICDRRVTVVERDCAGGTRRTSVCRNRQRTGADGWRVAVKLWILLAMAMRLSADVGVLLPADAEQPDPKILALA